MGHFQLLNEHGHTPPFYFIIKVLSGQSLNRGLFQGNYLKTYLEKYFVKCLFVQCR